VKLRLFFDLEFGFSVNLVYVELLCKNEILVKIFTKYWWIVLCEINVLTKVILVVVEYW
jgi:hypothetical protein